MKYKKLPVLIDAFLLGVDAPPRWFTEAILNGDVICLSGSNFNRGCIIKTLEGEMMARPEMDYIVKGVDGELYPCKADIFEKTYERV